MKSFCSLEVDWLRSQWILIMTSPSLFLLCFIKAELLSTSIRQSTTIYPLLEYILFFIYIPSFVAIGSMASYYGSIIRYDMSSLRITPWGIHFSRILLDLSICVSSSSLFYYDCFIIVEDEWWLLFGEFLLLQWGLHQFVVEVADLPDYV